MNFKTVPKIKPKYSSSSLYLDQQKAWLVIEGENKEQTKEYLIGS